MAGWRRSWQDGGRTDRIEGGALHGRMEERTGRRRGGTGWNFQYPTHFLPSSYLLPPSPPYFLLPPLLIEGSSLYPPSILPTSSQYPYQLPPSIPPNFLPVSHPFPLLLILTTPPPPHHLYFLLSPLQLTPSIPPNSSQYHTHFLHSSYLFLSSLLLPLSPPLPNFLPVSSLPTSSQYTSQLPPSILPISSPPPSFLP
jgi:hypothetical protein